MPKAAVARNIIGTVLFIAALWKILGIFDSRNEGGKVRDFESARRRVVVEELVEGVDSLVDAGKTLVRDRENLGFDLSDAEDSVVTEVVVSSLDSLSFVVTSIDTLRENSSINDAEFMGKARRLRGMETAIFEDYIRAVEVLQKAKNEHDKEGG